MKIKPGDIPTAKLHALLLGSVAPRPIAFASTIDREGRPNLSPFSFFNCFGSKPPILVFSPARRVRNNTLKHTLENIYQNWEVVINVVSYEMVQQMNLASVEFPQGVDEFVKSGFGKAPADTVRPFRVKESPVQFECRVRQVLETGSEGGAANLIMCEVLTMHLDDRLLNEQGFIDPNRIDLVARMGNDYYARASGDAVFEVPKPNLKPALGYDAIPEAVRSSEVLSGNDLGMLGNVEHWPAPEEIALIRQKDWWLELQHRYGEDRHALTYHLHSRAKELLKNQQVEEAWKILLSL